MAISRSEKARRFYLIRDVDVSGVSGTGKVAVGTQFPTGKCYIEWLTEPFSACIHDSIQAVEMVHGHHGKTTIVWVD